MNAITLLKQDHGNVEELFRRFEQLAPGATTEKAQLRDRVVEQLSVHAAVEEEALYPALRKRVPASEAEVLDALEEHHLVKRALKELERLSPGAERFEPKMRVLIDNVRHHVEEEERESGLFDQLRTAFTVEELNDLGQAIEKLKATAPKRPHPLVPDVPPLNLVLGPPAAVLDKVLTEGRKVVDGGRRVVSNALHRAS
jgi:hemerythrin-like domain-containing protein